MKNLTKFTSILIVLVLLSTVTSHKITGSLLCPADNCFRSGPEEADQVLTIFIQDISIMDRESPVLASKEVNLPQEWNFPLTYEIEFDHHFIKDYATINISARIIKQGSLKFLTDAVHDIKDGTNLRSEINMNLRRV